MYRDLVGLIVENMFLLSEKDNNLMNGGRYLILVEKDEIQSSADQIMEDRFTLINQEFKSLQAKVL